MSVPGSAWDTLEIDSLGASSGIAHSSEGKSGGDPGSRDPGRKAEGPQGIRQGSSQDYAWNGWVAPGWQAPQQEPSLGGGELGPPSGAIRPEPINYAVMQSVHAYRSQSYGHSQSHINPLMQTPGVAHSQVIHSQVQGHVVANPTMQGIAVPAYVPSQGSGSQSLNIHHQLPHSQHQLQPQHNQLHSSQQQQHNTGQAVAGEGRQSAKASAASESSRRVKAERSTRFRGITPHHGRWQARIKEARRDIHLGYFPNEEEAAQAYDQALIKFRGRTSATNFCVTDYETLEASETCVVDVSTDNYSDRREAAARRRSGQLPTVTGGNRCPNCGKPKRSPVAGADAPASAGMFLQSQTIPLGFIQTPSGPLVSLLGSAPPSFGGAKQSTAQHLQTGAEGHHEEEDTGEEGQEAQPGGRQGHSRSQTRSSENHSQSHGSMPVQEEGGHGYWEGQPGTNWVQNRRERRAAPAGMQQYPPSQDVAASGVGSRVAAGSKPTTKVSRRSSQYRGITRHHGRWQARIKESRRDLHLGYFDSEEEAAKAYDRAALQYRGKGTATNFSLSHYPSSLWENRKQPPPEEPPPVGWTPARPRARKKALPLPAGVPEAPAEPTSWLKGDQIEQKLGLGQGGDWGCAADSADLSGKEATATAYAVADAQHDGYLEQAVPGEGSEDHEHGDGEKQYWVEQDHHRPGRGVEEEEEMVDVGTHDEPTPHRELQAEPFFVGKGDEDGEHRWDASMNGHQWNGEATEINAEELHEGFGRGSGGMTPVHSDSECMNAAQSTAMQVTPMKVERLSADEVGQIGVQSWQHGDEERLGEARLGEERLGEERLGEERLGEERLGWERTQGVAGNEQEFGRASANVDSQHEERRVGIPRQEVDMETGVRATDASEVRGTSLTREVADVQGEEGEASSEGGRPAPVERGTTAESVEQARGNPAGLVEAAEGRAVEIHARIAPIRSGEGGDGALGPPQRGLDWGWQTLNEQENHSEAGVSSLPNGAEGGAELPAGEGSAGIDEKDVLEDKWEKRQKEAYTGDATVSGPLASGEACALGEEQNAEPGRDTYAARSVTGYKVRDTGHRVQGHYGPREMEEECLQEAGTVQRQRAIASQAGSSKGFTELLVRAPDYEMSHCPQHKPNSGEPPENISLPSLDVHVHGMEGVVEQAEALPVTSIRRPAALLTEQQKLPGEGVAEYPMEEGSCANLGERPSSTDSAMIGNDAFGIGELQKPVSMKFDEAAARSDSYEKGELEQQSHLQGEVENLLSEDNGASMIAQSSLGKCDSSKGEVFKRFHEGMHEKPNALMLARPSVKIVEAVPVENRKEDGDVSLPGAQNIVKDVVPSSGREPAEDSRGVAVQRNRKRGRPKRDEEVVTTVGDVSGRKGEISERGKRQERRRRGQSERDNAVGPGDDVTGKGNFVVGGEQTAGDGMSLAGVRKSLAVVDAVEEVELTREGTRGDGERTWRDQREAREEGVATERVEGGGGGLAATRGKRAPHPSSKALELIAENEEHGRAAGLQRGASTRMKKAEEREAGLASKKLAGRGTAAIIPLAKGLAVQTRQGGKVRGNVSEFDAAMVLQQLHQK